MSVEEIAAQESQLVDRDKLDAVLDEYVENFTEEWWEAEKYKWEAVEHFQQNWDIDAEDFPGMLDSALGKTGNLLASQHHYPRGMIVELAKFSPEKVRRMFTELFDESVYYIERIAAFRMGAEELLRQRHANGDMHYQTENAVTTYLWLRFPGKYSVYKFSELKAIAAAFGFVGPVKAGHVEANLHAFNLLSSIVIHDLSAREDLMKRLSSFGALEFNFDPQPTLVSDLSYYLFKKAKQEKKQRAALEVDQAVVDPANEAAEEFSADNGSEDTLASAKETNHAPSAEQRTEGHRYWWLNANPKIWSMRSMPIGEEQSYTLLNDEGNRRRMARNFDEVQPGDLVIGYESTPVKKIVALCQITQASDGERIHFRKIEGLGTPIPYTDVKGHPELENMEGMPNFQGSLFKVSDEEFKAIMELIREENPAPQLRQAQDIPVYTEEDFLAEVFMSPQRLKHVKALLQHKKNIILQGAPGVGKTFAARRLAWAMMGCQDNSRIELVQFHQSYSYEDFVMGYKPGDEKFEMRNGVFYRFCEKAQNSPDQDFYFIIDEINRGNLSKIFGELLMLIEKDYRDTPMTLVYDGLPFAVPSNLYIIGMMNTADRSLAMIDYALRRRFSFVEITPGFETDGFTKYQKGLDSPELNRLLLQVKALNEAIIHDRTLGAGFQIGHSYFCGLETADAGHLHNIVEFDLIPTLVEYWFDDSASVERWSAALRGAVGQ